MSEGLYEADALAWADRQSGLLRRLARGEGVNEAVDWPNVIEEVQDVGLSELRACQSLLQQAITHLLKLKAWPCSSAIEHWIEELGTFLDDAGRRYTPSMRQRIGLEDIYRLALRRVGSLSDRSGAPVPLPQGCPFVLADLLSGDITVLMAKLDQSPC